MLINDFISLHVEPAMNADKCLLPGFDCPAAHANKRQTGEPDQKKPGKTAHALAMRLVKFDFIHKKHHSWFNLFVQPKQAEEKLHPVIVPLSAGCRKMRNAHSHARQVCENRLCHGSLRHRPRRFYRCSSISIWEISSSRRPAASPPHR